MVRLVFRSLNVIYMLMHTLVFLDDNNTVKLGDFGLSKQLAQASFANTYVGVSVAVHSLVITLTDFFFSHQTPYYMSPELMQEKAYDSKSDIWSLGCLIYELCALKPPFHEAKTHAELSIFIRYVTGFLIIKILYSSYSKKWSYTTVAEGL